MTEQLKVRHETQIAAPPATVFAFAMVVLPTARSPMISSRWPRPSANSVSTASFGPAEAGA